MRFGGKHEEDPDDSPPGISVVTKPERFVVTHAAADRAIAELCETYDVTMTEHRDEKGDRVVTLTPSDPVCNPLRVEYTSFPGVLLCYTDGLGGDATDAYPPCGCDYCGETGDEVAEELTRAMLEFPSGTFFSETHLPWRPWRPWRPWKRRPAERTYAPWTLRA
jgi:hypothetical protein